MWNWQRPEWPNFVWDAGKLARAEALFIEGAGVVIGASKHLDDNTRKKLTIELMSHEAVDTSAIEGERLDRDSVQSSIQRHLGIAPLNNRATPAEAGIADMMVDLYRHLSEPVTEATLCHWHERLMTDSPDIQATGRYRTHDDAMQIVSGALHAPKVHFEAPPSARVPEDMQALIAWLAQTAPKGNSPLSPVTRAGIAHIWFESVHPFEDGNGRVGRCLIEKILAQGLSVPILTGLSGTLLKYRKAYYARLEAASLSLDVSDWLLWFASKAIEAQRHTLAQVEFTLNKSRLLDRVRERINTRQEKALMRLFAAGPAGFTGGLSADNYMRLTDATSATTTRDLADLVVMGALRRTGERKSTRYWLNIDIELLSEVGPDDIL
jgi:Fic family protein